MSLVNLGLRLMLSTLNNGGGSGVAGGLDKADSQSGSAAASLSQVYHYQAKSSSLATSYLSTSSHLFLFCF